MSLPHMHLTTRFGLESPVNGEVTAEHRAGADKLADLPVECVAATGLAT